MSQVIVINSVTLDGVMQGPGRPDEDTRDGFALGGWAAAAMNADVQAAVNQRVSDAGGLRLLLGRRSYEEMLNYWNTQDSPFKDGLNNAPKYVASTTLRDPAPWPNTTLLGGNVHDEVSALKKQPDNDLVIMGSGQLIQSLTGHDLIDEYMLIVHPCLLGAGRRLFPEGTPPKSLHLVSATPTSSGAVVAVYRTRP